MTKFNSPLVLGINQNAPSSEMDLSARLSFYGNNTGNLLFGEALFQVVDHSQRAAYHYGTREIEQADVVVIAAANWINAHSDFGNLAERLKTFGKPVVLVGIGIQVSGSQRPQITAGTRALLDLAAETSAMISTRGHQTEEVLRGWGYNNIMATGCPSLLLSDGRFMSHVLQPEPTPENTVLMSTRHLMNKTTPDQRDIYRLAYQSGADILMQSELADMYFIENTARDPSIVPNANHVLTSCYGEPDITKIRKYLTEHGKVFFHAKPWRSYLQGKEYVIGTRIHGTIAAILSGQRAVLLNHDPRTAELADIMGIPTASIDRLNPVSFEKIAEIIKATDFDLTRRNFPTYYGRFQDFFQMNGISMRSPLVRFGE